jgi:hypothetical protein
VHSGNNDEYLNMMKGMLMMYLAIPRHFSEWDFALRLYPSFSVEAAGAASTDDPDVINMSFHRFHPEQDKAS